MWWFVLACLTTAVLVDAIMSCNRNFSLVLFVKSERRDFDKGTLRSERPEYSHLATLAANYQCTVQLYFLVGQGPPLQCMEGSVLVCPSATDDYLDLPLKTWEALCYGTTDEEVLQPDGFVFVDSNVRFRAEDLLAEVQQSRSSHYWGSVLNSRMSTAYLAYKAASDERILTQFQTRAPALLQYPLQFEREVQYCSGGLYFLSAALARIVVSQQPPQLDAWNVDPFTGYIVKGDDLFEDIMVGRRVPAHVERTLVRTVFWERTVS